MSCFLCRLSVKLKPGALGLVTPETATTHQGRDATHTNTQTPFVPCSTQNRLQIYAAFKSGIGLLVDWWFRSVGTTVAATLELKFRI
jgi:hypothetical protein